VVISSAPRRDRKAPKYAGVQTFGAILLRSGTTMRRTQRSTRRPNFRATSLTTGCGFLKAVEFGCQPPWSWASVVASESGMVPYSGGPELLKINAGDSDTIGFRGL
jgi:hypothetical protein